MSLARLGYLGPEGSFTHQACRTWAEREHPGEAELVGLPSIRELFVRASAGLLDEIVCPLENSLEGSVVATIDLWLHESPLYQVGEVVLPVEHLLLARPGMHLGQVQAVLSHPHALAQCRRTLKSLLPSAELRPATSTAEAARQVSSASEPWAAVAGEAAAALYGLVVLFRGLEDGPRNATRFGVFGRRLPPPTGHDRTSIVVGSLHDRPGLLRDLLSEFADRGINLTRIESRPSREGLGRYLFLIDLEGHAADGPVREALQGVREKAGYLRLLGAYRMAPDQTAPGRP